ncbi:MAG: cell division topological specificity factor MinE [Synergistaceae bacterium]|jgi:cell division topological specificity factor|nr:cell division topological specificity factor MinE [Synergistaceae bacterium]
MSFISNFSNLFGIGRTTRHTKSSDMAKNRLTVAIAHDRTDISPGIMENMRRDIIAVLKKYVEIDEGNIELDLENDSAKGYFALVASVPVMKVRRTHGKP